VFTFCVVFSALMRRAVPVPEHRSGFANDPADDGERVAFLGAFPFDEDGAALGGEVRLRVAMPGRVVIGRGRNGRFVLVSSACALGDGPPPWPSTIHDLRSTIRADRRFGRDVAELGMAGRMVRTSVN
jgi:hypothetical protein